MKAITIFITRKEPLRQSNCSSLSQGVFAICISLCHGLLGISTNKETASSESGMTDRQDMTFRPSGLVDVQQKMFISPVAEEVV